MAWPRHAFWWACALAAPPVALATAAAGFAMKVSDVPRDVAVIVAWSVAEEIVFRGGLQPWLARALPERWQRRPVTLANLATSAVFCAAHLWRHPWPLAVAVFPVSLVYGAAREQSGRVWAPALLHTTFNLLLYAASWLRIGG